MGVSAKIINKPQLYKKLDDLAGKAAKQAFDNTMSDMRKRAPAIVAKCVVMRYNIGQGEIKPSGGGSGALTSKATGGSIGHVSVGGATLSSMTLVYTGRVLTPVHFHMSTTGGKVAKMKATIIKGHRVQIGHGGPKGSEGGSRHPRGSTSAYMPIHGLPFQREAGSDKPNKVLRTVAIPEMITHKFVGPAIEHDVSKLLLDRFTHNMQRFLG